jgi:hypothetical protein
MSGLTPGPLRFAEMQKTGFRMLFIQEKVREI